jgi:hypothetical protein
MARTGRGVRQTATQKPPPKADPRTRVDVGDDDRERLLRKYLAMKAKEQDYHDEVADVAKALKVGEGLGKVNLAYNHETGRFTVTQTG